MWGIFKIKQTKKKLTDIENRLVVSGGGRWGEDEGWEKWVKGEYMYKTENKNKIKKAIRRQNRKKKKTDSW